MNVSIAKKMEEWKKEYGAKRAYFTAEEWSVNLGMNITPQRLLSMYKQELVLKEQNKCYYGDTKVRWDIPYKSDLTL